MIEIEAIELEGYVRYRQPVRLELNRHPFSIIRGLNRDTSTQQSNAAGKSLLVSPIPNIILNQPLTANRKNSARDFHRKGSRIELFLRDRHRWRIGQYGTDASFKTRIYQNGNDLKIRTVAAAQERIKQIFPLSAEAIYSYLYVNVAQPNPIQRGTAPQRYDFFESIFNLQVYDRVAAYARKQANESRDARLQLTTLEEQFEPVEWTAVKQARNRLEELQERRRRLVEDEPPTREIHKLESYLRLSASDTDLARWHDDELRERIEQLERRLKRHADEVRLQDQSRGAYQRWREDREARRKLLDERRELGDKPTPPSIDEERLHELRTRYQTAVEWWQNCPEPDKLGYAPEQDPQPALHAARSKRQRLDDILQHRHTGLDCDACGQRLSGSAYAQRKKEIKQEALDLTAKIKRLQRAARYWKMAQGQPQYDERECRRRLAKVERRLQRVKEDRDLLARHDSIERALAQIKRWAKPPPQPQPPRDTKEQIAEVQRRFDAATQERYRRAEMAKLGLQRMDRKEVSQRLATLNRQVEQSRKELAEIDDRLQQQSEKVHRLEERWRLAKQIGDEIDKLRGQSRYQKHWSAIADAYGPKGMRVDTIRQLAQLYVENLNRYAGFVFMEPFRFEAVVNEGVFQLLATRGGQTSDVWYLSQAESRLFPLLSVIALLPLIPQNMRTNLLILDDIESSMSPETRDHVVNNFLPKINMFAPNVVVITAHPKNMLRMPGAREVLVTRQNGRSTVKVV